MGKQYDEISPELGTWLGQQHVFFIATSPLASDGHVNCSPKGMDTFRILGPRRVAYLDLTGSGVETVAHFRENGRIVFMFAAFAGPPKIVRLHGTAEVITPESPEWSDVSGSFPDQPGARAIISASLDRISDACGWGVPEFAYVKERDALHRASESATVEQMNAYWRENNSRSVDGLPGLEVLS